MRRVIGDLLYDTDTAEIVHMDENSNRILYRTKNGSFFMLYPNGEIIPRDEEHAKSYLGKHDVPQYIELFGEPQEA